MKSLGSELRSGSSSIDFNLVIPSRSGNYLHFTLCFHAPRVSKHDYLEDRLQHEMRSRENLEGTPITPFTKKRK